jgi:hypothetical protein
MVQSPVRELLPGAQVCELIDDVTHSWNFPLISAIFVPEEVVKICSLPLSSPGQPDKLIWKGSSSGVFSVKSAYHLGMERRLSDKGESSKISQSSKVWKSIWRLNVRGVVKTFIWRVCKNTLPTRENLFKKGIISDPYMSNLWSLP